MVDEAAFPKIEAVGCEPELGAPNRPPVVAPLPANKLGIVLVVVEPRRPPVPLGAAGAEVPNRPVPTGCDEASGCVEPPRALIPAVLLDAGVAEFPNKPTPEPEAVTEPPNKLPPVLALVEVVKDVAPKSPVPGVADGWFPWPEKRDDVPL